MRVKIIKLIKLKVKEKPIINIKVNKVNKINLLFNNLLINKIDNINIFIKKELQHFLIIRFF